MTINFKGQDIELNENETAAVYDQIQREYQERDIHQFFDDICEDNNLSEGSYDKYFDRVFKTYRKLYFNDDHEHELIETAFNIVVAINGKEN